MQVIHSIICKYKEFQFWINAVWYHILNEKSQVTSLRPFGKVGHGS